MAFYDYKCADCGRTFEVRRGMSEKISPACPICGGRSQQVFYAFATMRSGGSEPASSGGSCGSCATHTCSSCACH